MDRRREKRRRSAGGTGSAVCGLCGVGEGMVAGRGAGGAAEVLEEAAGGSGGTGADGRLWSRGGEERTRRKPGEGDGRGVEREAETEEPAGRSDVVHEPAGGAAGAAEQV